MFSAAWRWGMQLRHGVQVVPPTALLTKERLDLIVKLRFFRHLKDGGDPDAERVYRWHIDKRTRGVEPGSWKRCVDDYVSACGDLLASITARGFDLRQPVPVGSNGRIRNGAHRIACCLLLGERVAVRAVDRPGTGRWGAEWFASRGMPSVEIEGLLKECESLCVNSK